jgi:hypothetical protein
VQGELRFPLTSTYHGCPLFSGLGFSRSENSESNEPHAATAIYHRTTGFLTSEDAIVKRRDSIYGKFGLEVSHIKDFAAALQSRRQQIAPLQARVSGETLRMWDLVGSDSSYMNAFLERVGADQTSRDSVAADHVSNPHTKRIAVTSESEIVCLAGWDSRAGLQNHCTVTLLADEDHPAAETALDCLFGALAADISAVSPVLLELILPAGSALAKKTALFHGFRSKRSSPPTHIYKVCIGCPVTLDNFGRLAMAVKQCSGLSLPAVLPAFSSHYQLVDIQDADMQLRHFPESG